MRKRLSYRVGVWVELKVIWNSLVWVSVHSVADHIPCHIGADLPSHEGRGNQRKQRTGFQKIAFFRGDIWDTCNCFNYISTIPMNCWQIPDWWWFILSKSGSILLLEHNPWVQRAKSSMFFYVHVSHNLSSPKLSPSQSHTIDLPTSSNSSNKFPQDGAPQL